MDNKRRQLKLEYKQSARPAGIFQIRNLVNEKVFVCSSVDLNGIFNRHRFQLNSGLHSSKPLQADWNVCGADSFAFEVLEEMVLRENLDIKQELESLEDLWLEKLQPYGDRGYNEPKKSFEERLQMIRDRNRTAENVY